MCCSPGSCSDGASLAQVFLIVIAAAVTCLILSLRPIPLFNSMQEQVKCMARV